MTDNIDLSQYQQGFENVQNESQESEAPTNELVSEPQQNENKDLDSAINQAAEDIKQETAEAQNENTESNGKWKWSENVEGDGDKPEWIREEFKTVEDQAKAYNELYKKFGSFAKAPEDYAIEDVKNEKYKITEDGENVQEFKKLAKDMNMSQDGFKKIVEFFNEKVAPTFKPQGQTIDPNEEIKKLGDNGKEQLGRIYQWTYNNFGEDGKNKMNNMVRTAEDAKMMLDIIDKTIDKTKLPDSDSSQSVTRETLQKDLQKQIKENGLQNIDPKEFLGRYEQIQK